MPFANILEDDCRWLSNHGYRVCSIQCREWKDQGDALAGLNDVLGLGEALGLPEFCPTNLDGLSDALSDVEVPDVGGLAIVLLNYDKFAALDRDTAEAILDILANESRFFMLFGQRLAVMVLQCHRSIPGRYWRLSPIPPS